MTLDNFEEAWRSAAPAPAPAPAPGSAPGDLTRVVHQIERERR